MGHAEQVPTVNLEKPQHSVFYLPMCAVRKLRMNQIQPLTTPPTINKLSDTWL